MKPSDIPVYCIESYPDAQRHKAPFYMTRLETLVQEFKGIDRVHAHDFYLVMFVVAGSGTHTIDFTTYPVEPNQLYFLTPGQVHSWVLEPGVKGYTFFFESGFFTSRYPKRLYEYPFFHSQQQQPQLSVDSEVGELATQFEEAYAEFETNHLQQSEMILAYLFIILETATRYYEKRLQRDDKNQYHKVRLFEELLNQYFQTEHEVRQYADRMQLTPNYLNALCQTYLNKSASQLIYDRIIIETKRLLTHTDLTIKEVSFRTGFKDTSYFARFFRKHTGETPKAFREQLTQNS